MSLTSNWSGPPLLSILIPTYNRSTYLMNLLEELQCQLLHCPRGTVEVVISDNCSIDETSSICEHAISSCLSIRYIAQVTNIGPDNNFLALINEAKGKFFWMIGDDDLPRRALLPLLVNFLRDKNPALLYLPSIWSPVISPLDLIPILKINPIEDDYLRFARRHHIWTTFISAWIVNRDVLVNCNVSLETISLGIGSYFIQLGWILPVLLRSNLPFFSIKVACIMATSCNNRGSHFLRTFCINYPDTVMRLVGQDKRLVKSLINPFLRTYLPGLILGVRVAHLGDKVSAKTQLFPMIKRLWHYPSFWLFCLPALLVPPPLILGLRSLKNTIFYKKVPKTDG